MRGRMNVFLVIYITAIIQGKTTKRRGNAKARYGP